MEGLSLSTAALSAAVEPACNAIRNQIQDQGVLPRFKTSENIIAYSERSLISTGFASAEPRMLSTFARDLSWLEEDLGTYELLRNKHRNVAIRFLTDTPGAPEIGRRKSVRSNSGNIEGWRRHH
jgi:hypothetical protein